MLTCIFSSFWDYGREKWTMVSLKFIENSESNHDIHKISVKREEKKEKIPIHTAFRLKSSSSASYSTLNL